MRPVDIIIKKRDRQELSKDEIIFFIEGLAKGEIPDYQASAWAMAVLFNGMTERETADLTMAMANSGEQISLEGIVPIAVDKHSTGGVGDKTTLVVEPIVAACGLAVGKMSGRGLGFSGGTLDKMESIPGYRTNLTIEEYKSQIKKIGLVLTGQTGDLAPADGKLYALRDVTGTVPSIPLIASSVMSKKIAGGAQAIVLDVKVGVGAFMANLDSARELAELMVNIGRLNGREVVAVLSDMNQPLGWAVGNALEVCEALDTLHGKGPQDFRQHCLELASHMLVLGKICINHEDAHEMARKSLDNGQAWEKFRLLVTAQGGDLRVIDKPELLLKAKFIETVGSPSSGYICEINAREVGETSVDLGAGRIKKGDPIDHSVGIIVNTKIGDKVEKAQPLFTIHSNDVGKLEYAKKRVMAAHVLSPEKCEPLPLFYGVIK